MRPRTCLTCVLLVAGGCSITLPDRAFDGGGPGDDARHGLADGGVRDGLADGSVRDGLTDGSVRDGRGLDAPGSELCGNAAVDPGETCDTGIPAGQPGACPATCGDQNSCTTDTLVNGGTCGAQCTHVPIDSCTSGDLCCPAGCNNDNDSDCPPPAACDDDNPCTIDSVGDGGACVHTAAPANTICRPAAGPCDVAEQCSGTTCPADAFAAASTECRASAGPCDAAENCTGSAPSCPSDVFAPANTLCRAANEVCDRPEYCTGSWAACPPDSFLPASTKCRAAAGICDKDEYCSGSSAACPPDSFLPGTTVCRAAVDVCDGAESCTGSAAACPADALRPSGYVCRAATTTCDAPETCNGTVATCPADGVRPSGHVCRAAAGPCDLQEICNGTTKVCPTNAFRPATYRCLSQNDGCIRANCTGSSASCPPGSNTPANTYCKEVRGSCDAGGCNYTTYGCNGNGLCNVVIGTYYSCPILYTWDGGDFAFESDLYPSGTLGLKLGSGYRKPDPHDAYVLRHAPAQKDGLLELRIVEELAEIDYLDEASLFAVDVPAGRQVVAWANNVPGAPADLHQRLVTIDKNRQQLTWAVHLNTGKDVSAALAASDGNYVVLSDDANASYWNTIEADLGNLSGASVVKLIVDGRSRFATTAAGIANKHSKDPNGWQTTLEVRDAGGAWVQVPRNLVTLVKPKEFPRVMAIDITNIFPTSDHRVRMSWFAKTHIDAIWIDTTPNVPLAVTQAPLGAATLAWHGYSARTSGDMPVFSYAQAQPGPQPPFPWGAFTRYGDVTPLLTLIDDMFVIFGPGDEVALRFSPPAASKPGMKRFYAIKTAGYYKQANHSAAGVPFTVAPLPFYAMSNFPYDPAVEQYPTDPAHQQYLSTWNTRIVP